MVAADRLRVAQDSQGNVQQMLLSNDKRNEQLTAFFNSPTATATVPGMTKDPVSPEAAKPMLPGARVDLRSGIQGI